MIGGRHRHGITIATGCAAAALAVAGVMIGASVTNHPDQPGRPGSQPAPTVVTASPAGPPTTPPPGTRYVSSLGAQIAVPIGWDVNDLHCHDGVQPAVSRGNGIIAACSTPPPVPREWASIAAANRGGAQFPKNGLNAREVPIGDIPATRAGGAVGDGMYGGWISVPSWAVSVTVRARTLDAVNAILDSMSLVTVDAYGCDTVTGATAGGGPEDVFTDPAPVSATVCYYGDTTDGRLQASTIRYGTDAAALAAALNDTAPGHGPARPAGCHSSRYPVRTNATVILRQADGGRSVIALSWESCPGAYMSNGRVSHRIDTALIREVMAAMNLGFMDPAG